MNQIYSGMQEYSTTLKAITMFWFTEEVSSRVASVPYTQVCVYADVSKRIDQVNRWKDGVRTLTLQRWPTVDGFTEDGLSPKHVSLVCFYQCKVLTPFRLLLFSTIHHLFSISLCVRSPSFHLFTWFTEDACFPTQCFHCEHLCCSIFLIN